MELNPYYLDRLMNHRVQEAVREERERILKLIESKLIGRATNVDSGVIDWSSIEGDVIALIKGENDD